MLEVANIWHYDHNPLENRQRHSERPFASAVTIEFLPYSHGNHHVALNTRWSRTCVQRYLEMY